MNTCTGNASDLGLFATGLWLTLGSPDDLSTLTISGYVALPSTLGQLNAYIGTCYSGISGAYVCPDMDNGSLAVVGAMFTQAYYLNLMKANAGAGGVQKILESREGDSQFRFVNASEIAKTYLGAAKDAQAQLKYLIKAYNDNSQGGNIPRSTDLPDIIFEGGYGYYGGIIRAGGPWNG